jgi:hypothetical protein
MEDNDANNALKHQGSVWIVLTVLEQADAWLE